MSNARRKTFQYENQQPTSPKESEITTYTENTTSQSVPSLRVRQLTLIFVDAMMEKGFRKWILEKYDRFHVLLYVMILLWVTLMFIFDYLEQGRVKNDYFRLVYYGIAIMGILVTKLTRKNNDLVMIGASTVLLVVSTADDVLTFNATAEYTSIETNWFPMLIILHSSMSLIHVRNWLFVLVIPVVYLISYCVSRSFFITTKVVYYSYRIGWTHRHCGC